jgi:hypothetical protein
VWVEGHARLSHRRCVTPDFHLAWLQPGPRSLIKDTAVLDVAYIVALLAAWVTAGSVKLALSILHSGHIDLPQVGLGDSPAIIPPW